jgi:hypothetical protein
VSGGRSGHAQGVVKIRLLGAAEDIEPVAEPESWIEQARASGQEITRAELAPTASCEPLFSLADIGTPSAPPPATRRRTPSDVLSPEAMSLAHEIAAAAPPLQAWQAEQVRLVFGAAAGVQAPVPGPVSPSAKAGHS